MTLHHLTHSQRDAPEAHIVSNHQERSPRRTLSWRRRDKNNNQLPAHRVMTMLSSGNVPNDGNINFEDNQKSQRAHNSSIMRSNSHHGTMTGCNPNDSSKTYDHSISNNRRSFTGHIATSSSTVLATMLSFTKPNFTMRRNNQNLACNPVTTQPRNSVRRERSLSPGAVVDRQEVKGVTEGNEVSQETNNPVPICLSKVNSQIQGGGTGTIRGSDLTGMSSVAFHNKPKRDIEFERYIKRIPLKSWISRFNDMQRKPKSARSKKCTRKLPISGRVFASRKSEYMKLGLDLSYEEVKTADWKLQASTSPNFNTGRARKARPGNSNLRYCLTYTNQASNDTLESTCDWTYDRVRRWLFFGDYSTLCNSFE